MANNVRRLLLELRLKIEDFKKLPGTYNVSSSGQIDSPLDELFTGDLSDFLKHYMTGVVHIISVNYI